MATMMLCAFFLTNSASVYAENETSEEPVANQTDSENISTTNITADSIQNEGASDNANSGDNDTPSTKPTTKDEQQDNLLSKKVENAGEIEEDDELDINDNDDEPTTTSTPEETEKENTEVNPPHDHEFGEWIYYKDGTHIRKCKVEGCNQIEQEDCSKLTKEIVKDGRAIKVCSVCEHEIESSWSIIPEIKNVQPDRGQHESYFYSQQTISAEIYCEDIEQSNNLTSKSSDEDRAKAYEDGLNVILAIKELSSDEPLYLKAEATCSGGIVTYSWSVPADADQNGVYYVVGGIVAENKLRSDYDAVDKYELNYNIFIPNPDEENQKATFTVKGNNGFEYDANDLSGEHWYSNSAKISEINTEDNTDQLTVVISGEAYGYNYLKINSFKEIKNGVEKNVEAVEPKARTVKTPYTINFLWWEITRYRNETVYDYQYYLPTDVEGEHLYQIDYTVEGKDYTKYLVTYIDNTAPKISPITYNDSDSPKGSDGADESYYHESVDVKVTVKEEHLSNTDVLEDLYLENETTGQKIEFKRIDSKSDTDNVYTFLAKAEADGRYSINGYRDDQGLKIRDLAGNKSDAISTKEFVIDTKNPVATISFDNDNVKNGKYYNAARTATIKVTDENFAASDSSVSLNINAKYGSAKESEWTSDGENSYSKKITFAEDGYYSLTFSCRDKAANQSNTEKVEEFVVDTTKPEISVSFNNNDAKNKIYYNAARTATITFKDISFSESLVGVTSTGDKDLNAVPAIGSYSSDDNKYETTVKFEKDGRYGFKVSCEDLAGNVSDGYVSDVFVIDTEAPELEIVGVENMSANNGAVEPIINVTDLNLVNTDVDITLTGSNNGAVSIDKLESSITGGYTFKLSDIAHEKENDDLYTLVAKVVDQAGNETEKTIKYSVNRFGSVYVLSDGTKNMVNKYYVTDPQNVVITEINVDSLTYKDVSVTNDGNVKRLKEGKGYTTSDLTNDKGWHSISYTVDKKNFSTDGIYSVAVFSEDRATNKQSNQSKDAEVEFLLDMTAPSVVVSGLDSDGVYKEASHDFSINATDTIGVASMTVYVDDKELEAFSSEELAANGGTEVLTIPGKQDYQQIEVQCFDVAGNETRLAFNNVLIAENADDLIADGTITKVEIEDEISPGYIVALNIAKKAVAAVIICGALSAAGVFGFRKFKLKK